MITYNNPESSDELLKCFDAEGNIIKSKLRKIIHTKPYSIWHGVANIWLISKNGEILCSKRSNKLPGNPGKWQTYFGGHVKDHASFSNTIQDELDEEIGIKFSANKLVLIDEGKRKDVMHFYKSYAVLFEDDAQKLNFQDGEIIEVKFFTFNDYQKGRKDEPENWCNNINLENYKKIIKKLSIK